MYIPKNIIRLVLGTAQLGMDYGIANRTGAPDPETAKQIIKEAIEAGIREFDTAQAYGCSEKVLGRVIAALGVMDQVKIITKGITDFSDSSSMALQVSVERSLNNLGIDRLYGYMLHKERLLEQWHGGLGVCIGELLSNGTVERFGISVYSPEKALEALAIDEITIIQIPSNVIDRRFEDAGVFQEANRRRKRIYVRSVFLQGLLLISPEDLSSRMAFAVPALEAFQSFADSAGVSRHQLALAYVRDAYSEAKIIFGAETPEQVHANMESWQTPLSKDIVKQIQVSFKDIDSKVLNPVLW